MAVGVFIAITDEAGVMSPVSLLHSEVAVSSRVGCWDLQRLCGHGVTEADWQHHCRSSRHAQLIMCTHFCTSTGPAHLINGNKCVRNGLCDALPFCRVPVKSQV